MKPRFFHTTHLQRQPRLVLSVFLFGMFFSCSSKETLFSQERAECRIVANQIGYYPNAQKIAFVQGAVRLQDTVKFGKIADIVDTAAKKVVLRVALGLPVIDAQSGDTLRALDFSILNQSGVYKVRYGGVESAPFRIGRNVYDSALTLMIRSYYLQRCGVEINDKKNGIAHKACHLEDGFIARTNEIHAKDTRIKAVGGWHDAGDYGKYITTTAITAAELLSLFEDYGTALAVLRSDKSGIPESGNGVPDILDEIKVGLDWMLTMQRSDGAVYRKLSGGQWSPLITPDTEKQKRFVYGVSTQEVAKFAGVMAQAARVLKPFRKQFADTCLKAAQKAWRYLELHPEMATDWEASDDGGSGKYLESEVDKEETLFTDKDDRFYAASELYITLRDSAALHASSFFFNKNNLLNGSGNKSENSSANSIKPVRFGITEWKNAAPLAMVNLLRTKDSASGAVIRREIGLYADSVEHRVHQSGYRYGNNRIVWGSNKMAAEEGIALLLGYLHTQQIRGHHRNFLDAAQDQADFLLGRNPQDMCFVSGIGTRSVAHICHTFARAAGLTGKKMIPGLLTGGANELEQSGIAPKNRGLKSYADDERSYATNENAIDYNASAITLLARLAAVLEAELSSEEQKKKK